MYRANPVISEEPDEIPHTFDGPTNNSHVADQRWKQYNLLSLDGGGIRGYWSLLALSKLVEYIAEAEQNYSDPHHHSFFPQHYPENVSQDPLTDDENAKLKRHTLGEDRCQALLKTRRYLLCHYFDYICGSSTGALIAIMLGRFRMTVQDCLSEYRNLGGQIFGKPRIFTQLRFFVGSRTKYKGAVLQKVFESVTARRSELLLETDSRITFPSKRGLCKTFVTTLKAEPPKKEVATAYLIRSYDHDERISPYQSRRPTRTSKRPTRSSTQESGGGNSIAGNGDRQRKRRDINYGNAQTFQIWEVARAATAAPFYFEPLKIENPVSSGHLLFTDGGFSYTNNPTREGTQEIEDVYGADSIGVVVSVGTARRDKPSQGKGIRRVVEGIVNMAADPEKIHKEMAGEALIYYRLNDPEALNVKLDEWEPKAKLWTKRSGSRTMETIEAAFHRWAGDTNTVRMLQECASELVNRRRARAIDEAKWERYAIGAQFRCDIKECERDDFINRQNFKDHLKHDHDIATDLQEQMAERCKRHWQYQEARPANGETSTQGIFV